jgi:hypothetical protein
MNQPPRKPCPEPSSDSVDARIAWARELGRCDAFDSVLEIWEASDRELAPVRERRERELAAAMARGRSRTLVAVALGALALLAVAIPIAAFAHLSTPLNVDAKVGTISAALVSLQHDDTARVTR